MPPHPHKLFTQDDLPMTFFLVQESVMTRFVIENQGGRITDAQDAQHIIFNRDEGSSDLRPRNDEEQNALKDSQDWQFVLISSWISESGRQGQLVDEQEFQVLSNETSTSTSMTLRPIIPPSFDPIYHTPQMITPISSPSIRPPQSSAIIERRKRSESNPVDPARVNPEHTVGFASPSRSIRTPTASGSTKRPRAEASGTSTNGQQNMKSGAGSQVEVISYGSLKVWIRHPSEYTNLKNIPEPQRTYRKKDLFNILVIEIAHWAREQSSVNKGDVGRFLKEDLRKKRSWRDWYTYWRPLKDQINLKLEKLGLDTSMWDLEKGYSEVIYLSDDSDCDNEDAVDGVTRSNGIITALSSGSGPEEEVRESASAEIVVKSESEEVTSDIRSESNQDSTAVASAGADRNQLGSAGGPSLVYRYACHSHSIDRGEEVEDVKPEVEDEYAEEEGEDELVDEDD
ncbi:hypothetical protein I302_108530 [Kwoniella bestiolae CBS 10118]|uniref:BRCT domain-containing protein n=1 Tax=Kwoniella bestiolae CBS 10118 TaxID=1296100 RepID=A0A1B9FVG5_9TREE|nr:hypothetical protein I302_07097 [Kwoniella bestiolae CBS 10118]OCF22756.1 hypothetical protein I302_07097 [Kwoniella bestiolae CBS 10118]